MPGTRRLNYLTESVYPNIPKAGWYGDRFGKNFVSEVEIRDEPRAKYELCGGGGKSSSALKMQLLADYERVRYREEEAMRLYAHHGVSYKNKQVRALSGLLGGIAAEVKRLKTEADKNGFTLTRGRLIPSVDMITRESDENKKFFMIVQSLYYLALADDVNDEVILAYVKLLEQVPDYVYSEQAANDSERLEYYRRHYVYPELEHKEQLQAPLLNHIDLNECFTKSTLHEGPAVKYEKSLMRDFFGFSDWMEDSNQRSKGAWRVPSLKVAIMDKLIKKFVNDGRSGLAQKVCDICFEFDRLNKELLSSLKANDDMIAEWASFYQQHVSVMKDVGFVAGPKKKRLSWLSRFRKICRL